VCNTHPILSQINPIYTDLHLYDPVQCYTPIHGSVYKLVDVLWFPEQNVIYISHFPLPHSSPQHSILHVFIGLKYEVTWKDYEYKHAVLYLHYYFTPWAEISHDLHSLFIHSLSWYHVYSLTAVKDNTLTHNSGRVTQICVFNTLKLGTSASSP